MNFRFRCTNPWQVDVKLPYSFKIDCEHRSKSARPRFALAALAGVCFSGSVTLAENQSAGNLRPTRLPMVSTERTRPPEIRPRLSILEDSRPARPSWLSSTTTIAANTKAKTLMRQAVIEYRSKAWLSAEASAWESLSMLAMAIDMDVQAVSTIVPDQSSANAASINLQAAKDAIFEARGFGGAQAPIEPGAIARLARSHRTDIITHEDGLTSVAAADRYLDFARRNLAPLAAANKDVAEAFDLLAAIYIERDDAKQLPNETALCLRRAALQGQPENSDLAARLGLQLADIGLIDEAAWAMEHSLEIAFQPAVAKRLVSVLRQSGQVARADHVDQRLAQTIQQQPNIDPQANPSVPSITQLSPEEFAAVSPPVMSASIPASLASTTINRNSPSTQPAFDPIESSESEPKQNAVLRWFGSIKKPW